MTVTDFERRVPEGLAAGCAERSFPKMDLNAIAWKASAKNIAVAGALARLEAKRLVVKGCRNPHVIPDGGGAMWAIRPEGVALLDGKRIA